MAHYTTRIELHVAEEENSSEVYETLDQAMENLGFTRTIKSRDGNTYRLPSAEYNFEGEITVDAVLDKAKYAATTTRHEYEILVSEAPKRRWIGLKEL